MGKGSHRGIAGDFESRRKAGRDRLLLRPFFVTQHAGLVLVRGNGDGTFQPSPFATIATPAGATFTSAAIGDLDGDGHPDLILQHMTDMAGFTVAYGDGASNFTVDPNTYTTRATTPVFGNLVRLNHQATTHTSRPDYLVTSGDGVISSIPPCSPHDRGTRHPPLANPSSRINNPKQVSS
ncbi:MAG TPA: VCBS repeat-containing protein [Edaphobacter sp.]|nr:VCBS repeat-containing protein [Edaphobacter sp.]